MQIICAQVITNQKKEATSKDNRAKILNEISKNVKNNVDEIRSNMITYFLQKSSYFSLSEEEKINYIREVTEHSCTVDRIILESFEMDKDRNDFYMELFKNFYDKNSSTEEQKYHESSHQDITFFFTQGAWEISNGAGKLDEKLTERNNGIPLGNVFVFVFSDSELPILSSSKEDENKVIQALKDVGNSINNLTKSIHAIVFDNCSVRLFCCLDDDAVFEKVINVYTNLNRWLTRTNAVKTKNKNPEFIYFWDWRKMNVHKNGTAFLGFDFSNTSKSVVANKMFQQTTQFEEINTIGEILLQFQYAYETDDFHYKQAQEFLNRQIRNYIYTSLWRPSLNISDAEQDKMERYNFIWTEP